MAILDADKEGFLRSERSLIQTIGRAARNVDGRVILYADKETDSIKLAMGETERRREVQAKYNEKHGITPETTRRALVEMPNYAVGEPKLSRASKALEAAQEININDADELRAAVAKLRKEMKKAADDLDFELAAELRDKAKALQEIELALR